MLTHNLQRRKKLLDDLKENKWYWRLKAKH